MNVPSESRPAAPALSDVAKYAAQKPRSLQIHTAPIAVTLPRYKRKRCRNCDAKFLLTKPNRLFCSTACKNEYGRHGSAFGPLRVKLEKLVRKLVEAETKRGWTAQLATLRAAGFVMRDELPAAEGSLAARVVSLAHALRSIGARLRLVEFALGELTAGPRPMPGLGRAAKTMKGDALARVYRKAAKVKTRA
jgi:hypothetical protein